MSTQLQTQAKTGSKSSDALTANNAVRHHFSSQRGFSAEAIHHPIQAKLNIGQPDDKYEQEADRVADQVMRMPEPKVQRICPGYKEELQKQPLEEEEEELQAKPVAGQITPLIQRQVEEEEEEEEELQTKEIPGKTPDIIPSIEAHINAMRTNGQPLPASTRTFFELRFGYDFSQVRVHADTRADKLNNSLSARAFTTGQDIFFRQGAYNPVSSSGRKLLAHELTHVVQQNSNIVRSRREEGISRDSSKLSQSIKAESTYMKVDGREHRRPQEDGVKLDVSRLSSGIIQTDPVAASALITELDRYGRREVLQGLVDAQKNAIGRFHDVLKGKSDHLTGFWSMIAGGAGVVTGAAAPGAVGISSAAAAPAVLVGGLIAAASILLVGQLTQTGIERFLHESRTRCRQEADAYGTQYEPTVTALANSFGQRVAGGQEAELRADTIQYGRIRDVFRRRILQAPSTNRTDDLKWNRLCNSWNQYLRDSVFWYSYETSARHLIMTPRRVRP